MKKKCKLLFVIDAVDKEILDIKKTYKSFMKYKSNDVMLLLVSNSKEMIEISKKSYLNFENYFYNNGEFIVPNDIQFDYISFVSAGYTISNSILKTLNNNLLYSQNKDLFAVEIKYTTKQNSSKIDQYINISEEPKKIYNKSLNYIFSNKLYYSNKNNNDYFINNGFSVFLAELIISNEKINVIKNCFIISPKELQKKYVPIKCHYQLEWYTSVFNIAERMKDYSMSNFNQITSATQCCILYLFKLRFDSNSNARNKHILVGKDLVNFKKNLYKILQFIDDENIVTAFSNKMALYLLEIKYDYNIKKINSNIKLEDELTQKDEIILTFNNQIINYASKEKIKINLIEVDNNMNIYGTYAFDFDESKYKLICNYCGKDYDAIKNDKYTFYKLFGDVVYDDYSFEVHFPLNTIVNKEYINFYLVNGDVRVPIKLMFTKSLSRLSANKTFYWKKNNYIFNVRSRTILVNKYTPLRLVKRETVNLFALLKNWKKIGIDVFYIRFMYILTKPFFKKDIWLFSDKIYKAGDNGEYLYNYSRKQKDGVKKYYVLKENTLDAKRFKKEKKPFIKYNSLKHKLLLLNSTIVFGTHFNNVAMHSFNQKKEKYFRDLFNFNLVNIQHGLTVQNIAHICNRQIDNTKKYYLAAFIEKENLLNKEYDYRNDNEILKITGSPRYDGLKSNSKKQILIAPTWRLYLANPSEGSGKTRSYNSLFKDSDYFKIYNNLINNEKLLCETKKLGYDIIFLLHPVVSSQIKDFNKNENISIIAATDELNYEQILTESDLMITDYSGIQFDFAYMNKPIIYYHPELLPPSYEEGAYNYENMSLGKIVKVESELVSCICDYLDNNCLNDKKYEQRVNQFFKYHDYDNCKRIYEDIIESFYRK